MDEKPRKGAGLERVVALWSRRKWLVIAVFVPPFVAACAVVLSLPNLYRATATVFVERQQVPESYVRPSVSTEFEARLQTINRAILGSSRLASLITSHGLYGSTENEVPSEVIVEQVRRDIQLEIKFIEGRGSTRSPGFSVSYRDRDPEAGCPRGEFAGGALRRGEPEGSRAAGRRDHRVPEMQIAETKKRLDEQERRVGDFKQRHSGELPEQMLANLATLEALNAQFRLSSDNQIRAVERREAVAAEVAEAESFRQLPEASGGSPEGPESLVLRLARLKQELTAAQSRYTDAHPTVIRLKAEIAALERELAARRPKAKSEVTPDTIAPPSQYLLRLREALHAAESELRMLKAEERRLRGAIAVYQARVENTPKREQQLLDISRDYDSTREAYHSLVKRYEEAQVAESMEQLQKGEQFRIHSPASSSKVVVAPNRLTLLMMALAFSAGLAAAVAMLAEVIDTSFHSAGDLRAYTRVPVLVRIAPIATEAALRQRRLRTRCVGAAALVAVALVAGGASFAAHGNEQLVRVLDRDRS